MPSAAVGRWSCARPTAASGRRRCARAHAPAPPPPDLAIVTTKSHHTLPAAHALAGALAPSTPVLSLQNGLENVARLGSVLGAGRVLGGIAFVGLSVGEPGTVDHEAEGRVVMGDPAGATELGRARSSRCWSPPGRSSSPTTSSTTSGTSCCGTPASTRSAR